MAVPIIVELERDKQIDGQWERPVSEGRDDSYNI
jgi:hypothetical protein